MSVTAILQHEPRTFKQSLKEITKTKTLVKLRDAAQEQENIEYVGYITKHLEKLIKNAQKQEDNSEFKQLIQLETKYATLNRYARYYQQQGDDVRLRVVSRRLQELVKGGGLKARRRKEGTGTRVEKTFVYNDTLSNRKLERVGKEYKKWVWEDAEYEEVDRKIRRRKIKKRPAGTESSEGEEPPKKKRRNFWIEAIALAKTELKAPAFLIVRREAKDPKDPTQKLGVKVYERAVKIMAELKEKEAQAE
jgi:hypothetical protein